MKKITLSWIIGLSCLLWLAPPVAAKKIQKFQSEQVHLDPAGQIRATNQIYSMPEKLRLEMNHPSGQGSMIMIFRKDKEVHWVLSPKIAFPLRTESDKGEVTKLRNIQKGAQPDDLFEIPEGYTQVSSMMELGSGQAQTSQPKDTSASPKLPADSKMPDWLKEKLKKLQE